MKLYNQGVKIIIGPILKKIQSRLNELNNDLIFYLLQIK